MTVTASVPGGTVMGEVNPTTGHEENDMSDVSLLITFNGFRYFIGGDTESFTEVKWLADLVIDVDAYQAHHHGSHSSSSRAFVFEALQPTVMAISDGSRADYGHPLESDLKTFSGSGSARPTVFQTGTNIWRAGRFPLATCSMRSSPIPKRPMTTERF